MESAVNIAESILNRKLNITILKGNPSYQAEDIHLAVDGWRVFIVLDGQASLNARIGNNPEIIDIAKDDALLVPAGFPVKIKDIKGELVEVSFVKAVVSFQHYEDGKILATKTQECHRSLRESSELRSLFQVLQEYAGSKTPLAVCKTASQLKILLAMAAEIIETGFPKTRFASKKRMNFVKVNKWIKENLENSFGLADVSEQFKITPQYLNKLSHYFRGLSFNNYINICRLEKARHLLLSEKGKVKELAARCGYNDPDYFIQLFRKTYSITPLQFRKKMQLANIPELHVTRGFTEVVKQEVIPPVMYHPEADKPQASQLFCNTLDEIVEILWMENNDSHVSVVFLNPGQRFITGSPEGHQWLAKNSNHQILGCYTAREDCGIIMIQN